MELIRGQRYIIKRIGPTAYNQAGLKVSPGETINITVRGFGINGFQFTLDSDPREERSSLIDRRERTPMLERKFKVGDRVRTTSNEENYTGKGIGYEFTIKEIWKGGNTIWCRENVSEPNGVSQDSLELVIAPVFKIGNIVHIVNYGNSYTKDRPHSIGDYGRVVQIDYPQHKVSIYKVETAHNKTWEYFESDLKLYSTTPVDLILIGGKSLPANFQSKITIACPDDFKTIGDILGEQHQKLMDNYMNNLLSSYTKPPMNTLQQEKFQNFVKKNGTKIIALSEVADEKAKEVDLIGSFMGTLSTTIKSNNRNLNDYYNDGDKDSTQQVYTNLGDLIKILSSKEYEALTTAFDNFKKLFK